MAGNAFANDLLAYFFKATNNDQAIKTLVQDQNKTTKAGLCIFAPKNQAPPEVNKISKQPKITYIKKVKWQNLTNSRMHDFFASVSKRWIGVSKTNPFFLSLTDWKFEKRWTVINLPACRFLSLFVEFSPCWAAFCFCSLKMLLIGKTMRWWCDGKMKELD